MSTKRVVHVFSNLPGILAALKKTGLPLTFEMIPEPTHQGSLSENHVAELQKADILITDPTMLSKYNILNSMPNLKWVMSTWAGVDVFMESLDRDKPLPKYILTRFGGCFGQHMAEFVIGHIIAHERKFRAVWKQQETSVWVREPFIPYRILPQLQIGILGAGDIGKEVAKACKNFDMTVWGMTNRPVTPEKKSPFIDHDRVFSDLPEILAECDYLCCVLPSTPQTRGMLSGDVLAQCKKKPVLINVGRGDLINEASIINALDKGWIRHAILDVVNPEPLPSSSPLWQHPNITLAPHYSAWTFDWQVAEIFEKNYKKFEANEKLDYQVDWETGY